MKSLAVREIGLWKLLRLVRVSKCSAEPGQLSLFCCIQRLQLTDAIVSESLTVLFVYFSGSSSADRP